MNEKVLISVLILMTCHCFMVNGGITNIIVQGDVSKLTVYDSIADNTDGAKPVDPDSNDNVTIDVNEDKPLSTHTNEDENNESLDFLEDPRFWEQVMNKSLSTHEINFLINLKNHRNYHHSTLFDIQFRLNQRVKEYDNSHDVTNRMLMPYRSERNEGTLENPKSWMSNIDDKMWLSEMSIPGTHDTMTSSDHPDNTCNNFIVKRCCQTQDWSLKEQLENGIRFIDVRLKHENNDFILHHDFITIGPSLKDVLTILKKFLKENPSETVIMSYQQTQKSENSNGVPFHKDFGKQIREVPENFIYYASRMPQLGEVRGKIVLLDWMRNGALGIGKRRDYVHNTWDNIVFWDWIYWNVRPEYFEGLQKNIAYSQSKEDTRYFFVSWLSANDCKKTLLNWGPRKCADNVNPEMHDYLMKQTGKGNYGVIVMDFPTKWMIKTIAENNLTP